MKKTYIAPEMEIKKFSVEDIMSASTVASVYGAGDVAIDGEGAGKVENVNYSDLFGI